MVKHGDLFYKCLKDLNQLITSIAEGSHLTGAFSIVSREGIEQVGQNCDLSVWNSFRLLRSSPERILTCYESIQWHNWKSTSKHWIASVKMYTDFQIRQDDHGMLEAVLETSWWWVLKRHCSSTDPSYKNCKKIFICRTRRRRNSETVGQIETRRNCDGWICDFAAQRWAHNPLSPPHYRIQILFIRHRREEVEEEKRLDLEGNALSKDISLI